MLTTGNEWTGTLSYLPNSGRYELDTGDALVMGIMPKGLQSAMDGPVTIHGDVLADSETDGPMAVAKTLRRIGFYRSEWRALWTLRRIARRVVVV